MFVPAFLEPVVSNSLSVYMYIYVCMYACVSSWNFCGDGV